ncbi:MAG TPA: nucleotidyltransferase family protein, partial [Candidatus Nanoarchaeia archaeon]|nr:nucleotidyltransferase family protein [Candidatus Nanoarchaeia archaeon]
MKAIILCAGKGERLKPLTSNIPKPMIPINGKPLLEYLILLCKKYGIRDIAINTSYLPEKIKEYFGDGSKFGVDIRYSFEQELLGAAGALNNFRDFLDSSEPFIVLYGDNITDVNLDKMIKFHKEKKALATLFLHKQEMADEKTTPGAVVFDAENRITNIIENPNKKQIEFLKNIPDNRKLTNSGIYILNPEVLE